MVRGQENWTELRGILALLCYDDTAHQISIRNTNRVGSSRGEPSRVGLDCVVEKCHNSNPNPLPTNSYSAQLIGTDIIGAAVVFIYFLLRKLEKRHSNNHKDNHLNLGNDKK